jgi:ribosomal protein S4
MKQTISKRLSKIFNILLEKSKERAKVYFRRPFIYEPRVAMGGIRKRKVNEQFISSGLVKLFYVMYNFRQLKKIAIKAKLQKGVLEHNYLSIIEGKLPSFIYRVSFFPTLFESLDFVKGGNV